MSPAPTSQGTASRDTPSRGGAAGPAGGRGLSPPPPPPPLAVRGTVGAGQGCPGCGNSSLRPPAAFRPYSRSGRWAGGRWDGNKAENQLCPAPELALPRQALRAARRGRAAAARPERGAAAAGGPLPPSLPPAAGSERQAPGRGLAPPTPRNVARRPRGLPPARRREGLLPAEPLHGPCSTAGGSAQGAPRSRLTTPRAARGVAHLGGHGAAGAGWAAGLPSPPRAAVARSVRPARPPPPPLGRAGGSSSASPSRRRRRRLGAVGRLSSKPRHWAGGG